MNLNEMLLRPSDRIPMSRNKIAASQRVFTISIQPTNACMAQTAGALANIMPRIVPGTTPVNAS
jgi:hypothetical protein